MIEIGDVLVFNIKSIAYAVVIGKSLRVVFINTSTVLFIHERLMHDIYAAIACGEGYFPFVGDHTDFKLVHDV